MLQLIIAIVALGLLWAAAIWLEFSYWIPAVVTVAVVLAFIGVEVWKRIRAKRAAKELERGLAAQAADQARKARPDMQPEIMEMQSEFQKALAALKSSKLGKSGTDALYALPWYVIIGPPGAGKSTALRNSGLQFPYLSAKGGGLRGLGGTRNCDWWLTNEAVLLDTAGRWSTDDEDRDEWFGFLDLVGKTRPQKPLNGLIVAVSVGDLGGASEDEVASVAKRIRDRLDEVMGRLSMRLPIYVLFTKSDLIPGFVEVFQDLSTSDRGQTWGFTAPVASPIGEAGNYFATRFDEMQSALESWSVKRMSDERKLETRAQIHGFPVQFAALRDNLSLFVSRLFEDNVYQETPMFRGAYFTSGTQEGRPIDRVMRRMSEAFGMKGGDLQLSEPQVAQKSYFLRDPFVNVMFKDADLAVRSVTEMKRQRTRRYIVAAAVAAVALFVLAFPTIAYVQNVQLLDDVDKAVVLASTHGRGADGQRSSALALVDPLQHLNDRLREYKTDGPPLSMRYGMYRGDEIFPKLSELYGKILRQDAIQPIVAADLVSMGEFGRRYEALPDSRPTPEENRTMYDSLKLHLLLTAPKEDGETPFNASFREWAAGALADRWAALEGMGPQDPQRERMRQHVLSYANVAIENPSLAFTRDAGTVRRVRGILARTPLPDLALERIIEEVEPLGYSLGLREMLGTSVGAMSARSRVRGAFTRRAWEEKVRAMLESPEASFSGEPWVYGQIGVVRRDETAQKEAEIERLRSEYFRQYIDEWQEFVLGVRVTPPGSNVEALAMLQDFTRGTPPPIGRFIRALHYNVELPVPTSAAANAAGSVAGSIVDSARRRLNETNRGRAVLNALGAAQGPGATSDIGEVLLTERDVKTAFDGFTMFAVPPAPPAPAPSADGQAAAPPPPASATPVDLDIYQEQLQFVRDALQTHLDNPGADSEALNTRIQTARTSIRSLIERQEVGWRPRFEMLLWPPIEGASMSSAMAAGASSGRAWCTDVVAAYERTIKGRYPFDPAGQDVPLADFTAFFKPTDGTLWGFYGRSLNTIVPRQGDRFAFSTRLGRDAGSVYQRSLLEYLSRANDVSNVFFAPGAASAGIEFDVRVRPSPRIATIQFSVGGTVIDYHNGPEQWTRASWPGESPVAGASFEVRGDGGIHEKVQQEGEWGFFHLLELGTVTAGGTGDAPVFTVAWRLRSSDVDVAIDIRPVRRDSPFFGVAGRDPRPSFLAPVRTPQVNVPREIFTGGATCR